VNAEDVASLGIVVGFLIFTVIEALRPARSYPSYRGWRWRGLLQFILIGALAGLLPLLLPGQWLARHRLLDGERLGTLLGVLVGYPVVSLVGYAWHVACHRFDLLWRGFHQLHHSPRRLDIAGATLFHPFDIAMYMLLTTLTTSLVLGLTPEACAAVGLVAQLYAFFQHMNVRTPVWLGYLIQRPESHFIHHERNVHAYNYSDFPLWDLLMGTLRNPKDFGAGEVGFDAPADKRLGAMLLFRDVNNGGGTQSPSLRRALRP
jgi:sterol desaturase/sphingolipid hydroxylase (fatty acid hydroxylase superfamily)